MSYNWSNINDIINGCSVKALNGSIYIKEQYYIKLQKNTYIVRFSITLLRKLASKCEHMNLLNSKDFNKISCVYNYDPYNFIFL